MPSAARRAAFAAAMAALLASPPLAAQVLYKWIDANGKVQYSDQPPKKHTGPVTRIEPDVPATPAPAPKPAVAPAPVSSPPKAAPAEDIVAKRRATRAALEKRLYAARDKLDAAKKALADASEPSDEERQVVQQKPQPGQGGMHGLSSARSNCTKSVVNGKAVVTCPTMVIKEEYFDRVGKLEDAVRVAEAELAEAEQAWRRGVD